MGVEAKRDAWCGTKKTLRCCIRTGWRCASQHWPLFSLVLLLYLLHRHAPGLFALLLSASPVIICTGLLLAALLCHGSARLPEVREDGTAPEQVSAGRSYRNVDIREEQQRFSVPTTLEKNVAKEAGCGTRDCNGHAGLDENVPLLKQVHQGDETERPEGFHTPAPSLKQEAATEGYMKYNAEKESEGAFSSKDECASSFDDVHRNAVDGEETALGLCSSREDVSDDVKVVAKADQQGTVSTDAQSADGSAGKCKWGRAFSVRRRKKLADIKIEAISSVADNQLDHSLCSPFATVGSHDNNSSSGFGPDNAEGHPPDVSMTDSSPVIDETETGPPLGVDRSCPGLLNTGDSDNHLNMSSLDRQPPSVNNEVADNSKAKDDGEEEEKDPGTEPAFLWTADNEKNAMDLGYSETERSRRLETLMVKRKSRKNIQFELDGVGGLADGLSRFRPKVHPVSVPARRMNPFTTDDAEIPGSAPPILHPRDDPFSFLTDEQPADDNSGHPAHHSSLGPQEPMPALHQDALFRRHESFSFGRPPQRHGPRLQPCFALEESSLGEASASGFQRQFSDRSVSSRLSVVSECDTVSSAGDQEHNELVRNYIRGVRESPGLLGQDVDGDAVCTSTAGNECSDGIGFVENETLNAVIC